MIAMSFTRQVLAAIRALLVLTVLLGCIYPLAITAAALAMPGPAKGSLVSYEGRIIGSSLIGQSFTGTQWFQPRPSASEYAGDTSGGSNYGQSNPAQKQQIAKRTAALRAANPDAKGPVPGDALTASASGLDPDISLAYARWQAPRVAAARHLQLAAVEALIRSHTADASLGFLDQQRVNVLGLNLALVKLSGQ